MKYIVKSFFRPVENRHYTNKKISAWLYAVRFFPSVLICLLGAFSVDSFFWLFLAGIVVYGFIDYIIFDAFLDKLAWKLIWSHFYTDEIHKPTPEHSVMKAFETDPSAENHKALQEHIQAK